MREFSRKKAHREHMIRNLATSLILYERVDTTAAKAKEIKSFAEKLIARSLVGGLSEIRNLSGVLFDQNAVKKVIAELIPRYQNRKSGFIHSYHLKNRVGDNSPMIRLELVDRKVYTDVEKQADNQADEKSSDKSTTKVKAKTNAAK